MTDSDLTHTLSKLRQESKRILATLKAFRLLCNTHPEGHGPVISRLDRLLLERFWLFNNLYANTEKVLALRRESRETEECEEAWRDPELRSLYSDADREALAALKATQCSKGYDLLCMTDALSRMEKDNRQELVTRYLELKRGEERGEREREVASRHGQRRLPRNRNRSPYRPNLHYIGIMFLTTGTTSNGILETERDSSRSLVVVSALFLGHLDMPMLPREPTFPC
ncbi:hypothetical protein KIPB_005376 [Kipferlia bialata]|uniref:Uncharacterized protein n=1 Tax=Kipferlia bialata TaxID=797122 RepID=A0A9K3GHB1_9EUKA|nr:hypothetical protein KIPB_005376 [Kipferlia bialata]|eukprot:g5376.t1